MLEITAGIWRGTVTTWMEPGSAPINSTIAATISRVLDGKSVHIDYQSHVQENRADGWMIVGKDIGTDRLALTWIDTFHTGSNIMNFAADESGSLRGTWIAGEEKWGWRVVIHAGPELRIEHFLITPAGEEARAIEAVLRQS